MEKVDILLATYNGEKYLKEQLDSILNQTHTNFRLIISDDKSSDNTRKILEEYKEKDARVDVHFQDINQGVVKNFEYLLKKVQSDYYMFSDQDDVWHKEKIEKSLEKIKSDDFCLVYSNLEVVDESLNTIYNSYWKLKGLENKIKKYNNFDSLYLNNYITGCTIIAKREFIKNILSIPKTTKYVLHDYWIALISSQYGKLGYIDKPLIKYRQHKDNEVGSSKKSNELKTLEEIRKLFIQVKIEHFKAFIENEDKFTNEEIRILNKKSLEYYTYLDQVKNINFKNWTLFWRLYKYEDLNYTIQNFLILNMPIIANSLFTIKKKLRRVEK